jgi:hypothetical protein
VSGSSTDDDVDTPPQQRLGQGQDRVLYHLKGRSPPVPRLMLEAITATHLATQPISSASLSGRLPPTAAATAPVSCPVNMDVLSMPGSEGVRCEPASGSASPNEGAGLGWGGVKPSGLFQQADEGHEWELTAFTPERGTSAQDALWFGTDRMDMSDLAVVLSESDAAAARLTCMAAENANLKAQVEALQRSLAHMVSSDTLHLITAQACQMKAVIAGILVQLELESDNLRQEIEALEKSSDETLQLKRLTDVKTTAAPLDNETHWQLGCFQELVGKEFLHELSQEMVSTEKFNGSAKAGCLKQQNIECGSLLSRKGLPEVPAENRAEAIGDADTLQTMVEDLLDRPEGVSLDATTEYSKRKVGSRDRVPSLIHNGDRNHLSLCDENWNEIMNEVAGQVSSSQETLDHLQILLTNIIVRLHPCSLASCDQTVDNVVSGASDLCVKINGQLTASEEHLPRDLSEPTALGATYGLQQCNDSGEQSKFKLDHFELQDSGRFVLAKKTSVVPADPEPREELDHSRLDEIVENLVLKRSMLIADINIDEIQLCMGIMQVQSSLTEIRVLQEHLNRMVPKYELDQAVSAIEVLRMENELLVGGTDLAVAEELMAKKMEVEGLHPVLVHLVSKEELECAQEQGIMLRNMVAQLHIPLESAANDCTPASAIRNAQSGIELSEGRDLVSWQARWDDTFEEVMRQATANEKTIELVNQRVGDMLSDLYFSAVEMERVEAIISDRVLVPAAVIQTFKTDLEIKDVQLYHMKTKIQDEQRTVEKMLEQMDNMVPKCELAEAIKEVERLRFELEQLGRWGQLSAEAVRRKDEDIECIEDVNASRMCEAQSKNLLGAQVEGLNTAELEFNSGERHKQPQEKMIQTVCESEFGTEILPNSDDALVLEEKVPRKREVILVQELWSAEIQAMEKIACACRQAILDLECCICRMVPRRHLLSAEEVVKRLEATIASNVHLPAEMLQLKTEINNQHTQLCNMTLQAQASTTLILGLHRQLNKMVSEGELVKIYRNFDLLLAEVERLQENSMGLVAIEALESVQDALQAKTLEIECLHTTIRKSAGHEELAGAKKQVLMLTESVSLLKRQVQEATAKTTEKEMLLAMMMNGADPAAEANPIRGNNKHCKEEVERMRSIIAETSAVLWPCLELCLADVDWLLQQTESVIETDSETMRADSLESDTQQELNQRELCYYAETMHINLGWGCKSSRFCAAVLAVMLFFVSLRFDAPAIAVV